MPASSTSLPWERLDWDTAFFGVPIGRADLSDATPERLAALDEEARAAGLRCLYGAHAPTDPGRSGIVQEAGWMLVEVVQRFQLDPGDRIHLDESSATVRRGTPEDLPALRETILALAPWSRYAVDRRFGIEAAERMQLASVEQAAGAGDDHLLLVAEDGGQLLAFVTVRRAPGPIIDTMATTTPGAGAAHALIEDARRWAGDEPLSVGWVSARNVACTRSVSRFGFRVAEISYRYHRWLD